MNVNYRRLKLSSNDDLGKGLNYRDKAGLRLVTIFKSIAGVLYEDTLSNPWKMFFYCGPVPGGGWTVGLLTCMFYLSGVSMTGRHHRKNFFNACAAPVNYKLYTDFMSASGKGIKTHFQPLRKHMKAQAVAYGLNRLEGQVRKMPEGWVKSRIEPRLRKKIFKGELVLAS